jgi:hypothetical protein
MKLESMGKITIEPSVKKRRKGTLKDTALVKFVDCQNLSNNK